MTSTTDFSESYLQYLLKGDRAGCSAVTKAYLQQNPSIKDLYEKVLKAALYQIGHLWETNKITVAAEHLATAITEGILNELFEQIITGKKYNKKVVLACVENEQHQVGIKMVADVFEMKGWESYFLGSGVPTYELIRFIDEVQPNLLAISLSVFHNFSGLIKMLEAIRVRFPVLHILLGGQAFAHIPDTSLSQFDNILILKDLYLIEKYIDTINAKQHD